MPNPSAPSPSAFQGLGRLLAPFSGDADQLVERAILVETGGTVEPEPSWPDLSPWAGQAGLAGEAYQELRARREPDAARDGQVFTPWALARLLVDWLEPCAGQRWLDPAAGAGIFLQAARSAGVGEENLHALELDAGAAALGRRLLPAADWRLGDALASMEQLPAHWPGAFDRVVLNPPFRNGVERQDPQWRSRRAELRSRFSTAQGPFDLYVPFVERAVEFLRPQGRLGLLLPNTWLASPFGRELRKWMAGRLDLLRLAHAPGRRLFPRADFEILLLLVAPRSGKEPPLRVERLERDLTVQEQHLVEAAEVRERAEAGWGPLLVPAARRPRPCHRTVGQCWEVRASLTTGEYYQLTVHEAAGNQPDPGELRLLSSGSLEPFHHRWGGRPVRFRGQGWIRPVVRQAELPSVRARQADTWRVLLANLSRRLEALALQPGEGLGVGNVMQILCGGQDEAHALSAWLNTRALQEWVCAWYDPLRMNGQLSLGRQLVESLPAPPPEALPELAELGRALAAGPGDPRLQAKLDHLALALLP